MTIDDDESVGSGRDDGALLAPKTLRGRPRGPADPLQFHKDALTLALNRMFKAVGVSVTDTRAAMLANRTIDGGEIEIDADEQRVSFHAGSAQFKSVDKYTLRRFKARDRDRPTSKDELRIVDAARVLFNLLLAETFYIAAHLVAPSLLKNPGKLKWSPELVNRVLMLAATLHANSPRYAPGDSERETIELLSPGSNRQSVVLRGVTNQK